MVWSLGRYGIFYTCEASRCSGKLDVRGARQLKRNLKPPGNG